MIEKRSQVSIIINYFRPFLGDRGTDIDKDAIQSKTSPNIRYLRRLRRSIPITYDHAYIGDDTDRNPFEEIATRAPPRANFEFQQLRRHLKKSKKSSKSKAHRY